MITELEPRMDNVDEIITPLGRSPSDAVAREPRLGPIHSRCQVKWGSVTRVIEDRPNCWEQLRPKIGPMEKAPVAHDVMIARVKEIGRHSRIELDSGRKAEFFVGDPIAVAFGWRYATRQFYGEVPGLLSEYHMLSQGGVCGRVISAPDRFSDPTILEPIGYLLDSEDRVANLRNFGLRNDELVTLSDPALVPIIVVVGSSMDSGKTTLAANLIHGLTAAGCRINAGKLTGTACVKDLNKMADAGAVVTRDFTHAGFASTAQASVAEVHDLCDLLITSLRADEPDYLVLEIADGLVQRETQLVLDYLSQRGLIAHLCLAVHDSMAAPTCLEILQREWGINVAAVSGAATASPLSTAELRLQVPAAPCLMARDLHVPSVAGIFHRVGNNANEG